MGFDDEVFFDSSDLSGDKIGSYLLGGDDAFLDRTEDSAHTSGDRGLPMLAVRNDANASLVDTDGDYAMLQVDNEGRLKVAMEVTVEAGDAEFLEDSAHTDGDAGLHMLAVRQDTLASSVSADGDYGSFKINALGELYVKDTDAASELADINTELDGIKSDTAGILADTTAILADTANIDTNVAAILVDTGEIQTAVEGIQTDLAALEKAEDSVHGSGDSGIMALAVRNDAGTALAADGDYIPFSMDADGNLRVVDASSTLPNTALDQKSVTVGTTAVQLDASPLASRKKITVQNLGNKPIYIGASDVTVSGATGGTRLSKGSTYELELGPSVALYAISGDAGQDVRVLEVA